MDFFPKLEEVVTTYLSRYFVFVSNPSVYVKQYWEDGQVQEFKEYTSDKLRNVVKPYKFSFDIWDNSHLREQLGTKQKFVGCPFEDRVADTEYNLCVNAMPFLKLPHIPPPPENLQTIEPLLKPIRGTVCRDCERLRAFHSMGSAHSPEAGCEDRVVPVVHERTRHWQGLDIGNIVAQYL